MTLGDLLRLEAEQLADAVVLVHDVVAGAQVGEGLERAAEAARRRAAAACGRPACRGAARARGRARRSRGAPARRRRRGPARPAAARRRRAAAPRRAGACACVRSPRRGAGRRRRRAGPARARPASSFSASASPRAASAGRWRLERERLALRERVERGRAVEVELGAEPLLAQTCAHLVGLPDEVRAARSSGGTRSSGAVRGARRPRRRQRRLDQIGGAARPPGRRRASLDGVQRALRERREGADRLDLVAEELDPQRLAPVVGKTSTSPPRTANWPRSSTRSTRS